MPGTSSRIADLLRISLYHRRIFSTWMNLENPMGISCPQGTFSWPTSACTLCKSVSALFPIFPTWSLHPLPHFRLTQIFPPFQMIDFLVSDTDSQNWSTWRYHFFPFSQLTSSSCCIASIAIEGRPYSNKKFFYERTYLPRHHYRKD